MSTQNGDREALIRKLEEVEAMARAMREETLRAAQDQAGVRPAAAVYIPTAPATTLPPGVVVDTRPREVPGAPQEECCGCKDNCISPNCCCAEFVFKRVRMTSGQTGVDATLDAETTTGIAGAKAGLELQFFASLDGVGIIVPNQIWSYMHITKRKARPGVWHEVDQVVNKVCLPCGETRTYDYVLQGVEREVGSAEVVLGLDEFGQVTGQVAINCSCTTPQLITVPLPLDGGGAGGGEVEVVFEIRPAQP